MTMLPGHKSKFDKKFDEFFDVRLNELDLGSINILATSCPTPLLPILADSFDVDIDGLGEDSARKLIKNAFEIHYYSGTLYSLNKALRSFYADIRILEWFSYDGEPYCFKVEIDLKDDGTDETRYKKLDTVVQRYKNVRSVFKGFNLIRNARSEVYLGANAADMEKMEIFPIQSPGMASSAPVNTSAAYAQSEQVSVYPYKVRDIGLNLERFAAIVCEFIEDVNLPPMQSKNLSTQSTSARFSGGAVTIDEVIKI